MSSRQVIAALLKQFGIRDNPLKFAFYEHTVLDETKNIAVRRLFDEESVLGLVARWTEQTGNSIHIDDILSVKKLVLQENETGDIMVS
ncbi:Ras association (RalGDS AF-6) domain member [Cichlidogyrus casuarinus]|uniref:Ras association (RalGDS AF-6) domain member n=1 Tax=Cichlidogyrus casuarinus TaxID=1844966 RepID=A0ABD2PUJ3_9PLAT